MKISRPKILMCLFILGFVMLVQFAVRDMKLDVDLLRESLMKIPGLIMENISMSREISGDIWRVKIPYLEQEGSTVNLKSIDIKREISGDNREWNFFGQTGIYSHDERAASINDLTGTLETEKRTWTIESKKLNWQEEKNTLIFPEGLKIYDEEFSLNTPNASMDNTGVILLQKGGVIRWVRPRKR